MPDGFVIMQIGNAELDRVYEEAIAPAIAAAGLEPRRIDVDNEGGLLKSEIVTYLQTSDIIVADLTNERPNCYLEAGYAMGLGRNRHLVMTVREDHLPGNPGYEVGGPKVHFDLAGYHLLLWRMDALDAFRDALATLIQRRLAITRDAPAIAVEAGGHAWFEDLEERGLAAIHEEVGSGHMEVLFGLAPPKIRRSPKELLEAVEASTIDTFGWPIGLVLKSGDNAPRPSGNGVKAEIHGEKRDATGSFDLWELRTDGDFYLIHSLFEDQLGKSDTIYVDTRMVRVTEAILFCAGLYERLGVPPDAEVTLRVRHGGLLGRHLDLISPNRDLWKGYSTAVDEAQAEVNFRLDSVAERLPELVRELLAPLFALFDFFEVSEQVNREIVDNFVAGKLT